MGLGLEAEGFELVNTFRLEPISGPISRVGSDAVADVVKGGTITALGRAAETAPGTSAILPGSVIPAPTFAFETG